MGQGYHGCPFMYVRFQLKIMGSRQLTYKTVFFPPLLYTLRAGYYQPLHIEAALILYLEIWLWTSPPFVCSCFR